MHPLWCHLRKLTPEDRLPEKPETPLFQLGQLVQLSVPVDTDEVWTTPLLFPVFLFSFLIVQMNRVPSNEPQLSRQQGAECPPHPQSWLAVITHLI